LIFKLTDSPLSASAERLPHGFAVRQLIILGNLSFLNLLWYNRDMKNLFKSIKIVCVCASISTFLIGLVFLWNGWFLIAFWYFFISIACFVEILAIKRLKNTKTCIKRLDKLLEK